MPERWVMQEEAVRLLGVSPRTVARWARLGRVPAARAIRERRYDISGVLQARAAAEHAAEAAARSKRNAGPPAGWVLLVDVADDIGISRTHLRRAVSAGELELRRYGHRQIISGAQLDNWIEGRRRQNRTNRKPA